MTRRAIAIELINGVLKRPDIAQHWRVAMVLKKLQLMGYSHV